VLIFSLLLPTFSFQSVQANGVRVVTKETDGKYKITLTSQETGKGIKIVAFSPTNGKSINITYSFIKNGAVSTSIEIDQYMVIAPFRVITTNTDNLKYRPFKDILNTEYDEYIRHIHDLGITNGFSDGTFRPENTITRAEAAVMLATALKLNPDSLSNSRFADVNGHWAKKYINAIITKGIMSGYADKTFKPDNKITVAEVCAILSNSFTFKTKSQGVFTKLKKDQWYSYYVQYIFNLKILTPQDSIYETFKESSNISRGNFAMMLSRALSTL
jgi:hypothetical protein